VKTLLKKITSLVLFTALSLSLAQQTSIGIAPAVLSFTFSSGASVQASGFGIGGHIDFPLASWANFRATVDTYSRNNITFWTFGGALPLRLGSRDFAFYVGPSLGRVVVETPQGPGHATGFGILLGIEGYFNEGIGIYWDGQSTRADGLTVSYSHLGLKLRF
jgi:hypothetical protein